MLFLSMVSQKTGLDVQTARNSGPYDVNGSAKMAFGA